MKTVTIQNTQLPVVEYGGRRVVTFSMVDEVHGRPSDTARAAFNRNREHFIEGEDFVELGSDVIRTDLPEGTFSKFAPSGVILFESGYLMLTKPFNDPLSWQVQRQLVNGYFRHQQQPSVTPSALLNDAGQLRALLLGYTENVQRLEGEKKQLTATVDSLEKHFTKGMTVPAFCKGLNGVNVSKMMWWAFERDWIFNEQRDPEKDPRWRVATYARDKYLTEDQTQITPHGKEAFTRYSPVLLEKGCHRLYQLYMKGELPMKKSWNGEHSHDKASYTPEEKK